jgi:hypothetical protein
LAAVLTAVTVTVGGATVPAQVAAVPAPIAATPAGTGDEASPVVAHWTPARMAQARSRDLVVDGRGLGYLRGAGGALEPHGHDRPAQPPPPVTREGAAPAPNAKAVPRAKPGGTQADSTPPSVTDRQPAANGTVGASATFSAQVGDASGVRSVTFGLRAPDGARYTFAATAAQDGGTWTVPLTFAQAGAWSWDVTATDGAKGGGNTLTTGSTTFTVDLAPPEAPAGGDSAIVADEQWQDGGVMQTAVGRIYFEMPTNSSHRRWAGYVCSGTVVEDGATGSSVILTAAHCVYDDAYKAFARKVLFIPDQASGGSATDTDCSNDPLGCWTPSRGVVDREWTTRTFPDNAAWDYAYYVVPTSGHRTPGQLGGVPESLEQAAGTLSVQFSEPAADVPGSAADLTHALGYSFARDPELRYCAEDMEALDAADWWLPNCGLTGGSSGGPWIQQLSGDAGQVISVNSWGYTGQPGMAGPKLVGTSAAELFEAAQTGSDPTGGAVAVLG